MQLNPTMEKFYLSILDYAGMKLENNAFENKSEKLGPITIDDRKLTLPYFDNLKNPENKIIFHPLNENYTSPETTVFNLFKRRLVLELNLRLSSLIVSLISVASDVQLQQKIKSSKLIELVSGIGEVDLGLIDTFLDASKASRKVNDEGFLLDVFLKKNGEINDTPYAAIGKVNFVFFNEITRALSEKGDYRIFGYKATKKALLAFDNIFRTIFPSIDSPETFMEGTDNKVFRYLNILLRTSYQISHRINEVVGLLQELNEPTLNLDEIKSNLEWVECLEDLYSMSSEIRLIPNQLDLSVESNKLKLDESKASAAAPATAQTQAPQFDPSRAQAASQPQAQPAYPQAAQAPRQLTPEEIIRGSIGPVVAQPMMQPGMMQPGMMMAGQPMQQTSFTPSWVLQEQMRTGQVPQQQMQPVMQPMQPMQPMMQTVMTPQGVMMVPQQQMQPVMQSMGQPMMQQVMTPQGPMLVPVQQQPQETSLQINPHFIQQRSAAPWG